MRKYGVAATCRLGAFLLCATVSLAHGRAADAKEQTIYVYEDVTAQQAFDIFVDRALETFGENNVAWRSNPPKLVVHSDYGGWEYRTEIFIDAVEFTTKTGKIVHGVSIRTNGSGNSIVAGRGEQQTFVQRTKKYLEIKDIPFIVEESRIRKIAAAVTDTKPHGRKSGKTTGSGFVVLDGTYIATANHVVEGGNTISVLCGDEASQSAKVVASDPANDLALLRVDRALPYRMILAEDGSAHTGDKVFTIGFPVPDLLGPEGKYSEGVVSALSGIYGAANMLQMTTPIQPGNSGGPVVDVNGRVVGVVDAQAAVAAFYNGVGSLPQISIGLSRAPISARSCNPMNKRQCLTKRSLGKPPEKRQRRKSLPKKSCRRSSGSSMRSAFLR